MLLISIFYDNNVKRNLITLSWQQFTSTYKGLRKFNFYHVHVKFPSLVTLTLNFP